MSLLTRDSGGCGGRTGGKIWGGWLRCLCPVSGLLRLSCPVSVLSLALAVSGLPCPVSGCVWAVVGAAGLLYGLLACFGGLGGAWVLVGRESA